MYQQCKLAHQLYHDRGLRVVGVEIAASWPREDGAMQVIRGERALRLYKQFNVRNPISLIYDSQGELRASVPPSSSVLWEARNLMLYGD